MDTILGFFSFLLIELPARVIGAYPDTPIVPIAIAVIVLLVLLVLMRGRGRRRNRRRH